LGETVFKIGAAAGVTEGTVASLSFDVRGEIPNVGSIWRRVAKKGSLDR